VDFPAGKCYVAGKEKAMSKRSPSRRAAICDEAVLAKRKRSEDE
jgi:hypothetical protein